MKIPSQNQREALPSLSAVLSGFNLLGLAPTHDFQTIKRTFRREVIKVHPDTAPAGTPPEAFVRLQSAWEMFQDLNESGFLEWAASTINKQIEGDPERVEVPVAAAESVGAGTTVASSFPNMKRQVIVEYLGAGRFAVWLYGRLYRSNQTARGAAALLRASIGPGFTGNRDLIEIWIFAPSAIKSRTVLGFLEDELEALAAVAPQMRARRAPVGTPETPRGGGVDLGEGREPDDALRAAIREADWRGAYSGFVIATGPAGTSLFRLERIRGRVDFIFMGAYEGSAAALQHLTRMNISPDVVPVWLRHASTGNEISRLGAA